MRLWKCFEEQWRSINTSDLFQWSLLSMLLTPPLKKLFTSHRNMGFPGGASGKESACQCRRCKRGGFNPWVGKIVGGKGTATHSSVLVLEIPWTEEPGRLQCIGLQSQTRWKRLSTRSHRNGLILATLPDCKWPPESAGSGVPDERAYLHRLRSRHHPDH